jgi:hypothetical protein
MESLSGHTISNEQFERLFKPRGVSLEVAETRPYVRYERGDTAAVDIADPKFRAAMTARQYAASITKIINQCGGFVMVRHPVPVQVDGIPLPPILAELRPDESVETEPASTEPHEHPDSKGWEVHIQAQHGGVNWGVGEDEYGDIHAHVDGAKYVFASNPTIAKEYRHTHPCSTVAITDAHIKKHHDGKDETVGESHEHKRRVKDKSQHLQDRLDVHPGAVPLLHRAHANHGRVFFALEGCLKADAILSAGEAVFSVPSVTLWDAPELEDFAKAWLKGTTVIIVADSDWESNDAVIAQALNCRTVLRRYIGEDVHVAAPPGLSAPGHAKDCKHCKMGVDDFLGSYSGKIDDLLMVDRDAPPRLAEFWRHRPRQDALAVDTEVMHWLALIADGNGEVRSGAQTIAKSTGHGVRRVNRSINRLIGCGAITVNMERVELARKFIPRAGGRGFYSRREEWKDRPTISIDPKLRAWTVRRRLGES